MYRLLYFLMPFFLAWSISLTCQAASLEKYQVPNVQPDPVQTKPIEPTQTIVKPKLQEPDIYRDFRSKISDLSPNERDDLIEHYETKKNQASNKKDTVAEQYYSDLIDILKGRK